MLDMRRGTCPVCRHDKILESTPADFADVNREKAMAVTYDPRWVMHGRNPDRPHGAFRIYVCRSCGFTQWFADAPGEIPVGEEHSTRIIEGTGGGPFR